MQVKVKTWESLKAHETVVERNGELYCCDTDVSFAPGMLKYCGKEVSVKKDYNLLDFVDVLHAFKDVDGYYIFKTNDGWYLWPWMVADMDQINEF